MIIHYKVLIAIVESSEEIQLENSVYNPETGVVIAQIVFLFDKKLFKTEYLNIQFNSEAFNKFYILNPNLHIECVKI